MSVRLEKVYNVFNNLEVDYLSRKKKNNQLSRYDYLKMITKYSGSTLDRDKFLGMFSGEMSSYSSEEINLLDKLMFKYDSIIKILNRIESTSGYVEIDDIEIFIHSFSNYIEEEQNSKQYSLENFSVIKNYKHSISCKHLSSEIYEDENGNIKSKQLDTIGNDYVIINNSASLYNFIYISQNINTPFSKFVNAYINYKASKSELNLKNSRLVIIPESNILINEYFYVYDNKIVKKDTIMTSWNNKSMTDLFGNSYTVNAKFYEFNVEADGEMYCVVAYESIS